MSANNAGLICVACYRGSDFLSKEDTKLRITGAQWKSAQQEDQVGRTKSRKSLRMAAAPDGMRPAFSERLRMPTERGLPRLGSSVSVLPPESALRNLCVWVVRSDQSEREVG